MEKVRVRAGLRVGRGRLVLNYTLLCDGPFDELQIVKTFCGETTFTGVVTV